MSNEQHAIQVTLVSRLKNLAAKPKVGFLMVAGLHFFIALYYRQAGLDIYFMPWDELWQTIPTDLLRDDFLRSVWYFHAQPPVFNAFVGLLIKFFYPNQLDLLYVVNIICGSLLAGMIFWILWVITKKSMLALACGFVLALNPSLFLFEAYPLYTLLTAFLIVLSVFCLAVYAENGRLWLLPTLILVLNILILTRSLYHLIILVFAVPFVLWLAEKNWRRIFIAVVLISTLSVGWYSKNLIQFGFFGGSSWMGMGLWNAVSPRYNAEEMRLMIEQGILQDTAVYSDPFDPPSHFAEFGFQKTSNIPVLARDDYNNINVLDISKMYQHNAITLIKHNPAHYALTGLIAYLVYTSPPSRFYHLEDNAEKVGRHEAFVSQVIFGQALLQRYLPFKDDTVGSLLAILLPVNMLVYGLWVFKQNRFSIQKWLTYIRIDAVLVFIVSMILYTTAVSVTMEYVENVRFQFLVEQLIWVFIIVTTYRAVTQYQIHSPSQM